MGSRPASSLADAGKPGQSVMPIGLHAVGTSVEHREPERVASLGIAERADVREAATRSPIGRDAVDRAEPLVRSKLDHTTSSSCAWTAARRPRSATSRRWPISEPDHTDPATSPQRLDVRVESVAPRRSGLITKGTIYGPAHGDTAFTVPLFDDFLGRQ